MSPKTKGRAGCNQATPKTSERTTKFTGIAARMKAAVAILALWGWFPLGLAERISRMGGPRDE